MKQCVLVVKTAMLIDLSEYKVGVILSFEVCGKCKYGKGFRVCQVRTGTGRKESDFEDEKDSLTSSN